MQQDYSVHTDTGRVPHSHWGESGSGRTFLRELREFTRMNPASNRGTAHLDTTSRPARDSLSPGPPGEVSLSPRPGSGAGEDQFGRGSEGERPMTAALELRGVSKTYGEGATEVAVAGQLTIPPTITTISSTSEAVPINAARSPCRATGTRAATKPVGMTPAPYHLIRCNPVDTRPRRRSRSASPN